MWCTLFALHPPHLFFVFRFHCFDFWFGFVLGPRWEMERQPHQCQINIATTHDINQFAKKKKKKSATNLRQRALRMHTYNGVNHFQPWAWLSILSPFFCWLQFQEYFTFFYFSLVIVAAVVIVVLSCLWSDYNRNEKSIVIQFDSAKWLMFALFLIKVKKNMHK